MAPVSKRRGVSWGSDSESDISDYEYSYSKTVSRNGRETFPRNKKSHMNGGVKARYGSDEERSLKNRETGRWAEMMNGRYMWFGAFILFEAVNVITPWVVYYLISDPGNPNEIGKNVQRGNYGRAGWGAVKEGVKHTRGQDDLFYYPILAVMMTICALYICVLL
jgi:hypothetical protein